MTHREQIEVGAYLLGALTPRERSAFENHLAHCVTCQLEVAELAGVPPLLGKVALADVVPEAAPPTLTQVPGPALSHVPVPAGIGNRSDPPAGPPVRARRPITAGPHTWRHRVAVVGALIVLAALAIVGSVAVMAGPSAERSTTAAPSGAPSAPSGAPSAGAAPVTTVSLTPVVSGVHGELGIAARAPGSVLRLSMGGVRPGQQCTLLVAAANGHRQPVATWTADYEGGVEVSAATALPPEGIRWAAVTSGTGTVLLQATVAS